MNQILITFQFVRYLMNATMDKLLSDIFIVEKKVIVPPSHSQIYGINWQGRVSVTGKWRVRCSPHVLAIETICRDHRSPFSIDSWIMPPIRLQPMEHSARFGWSSVQKLFN